jgi:hypothetical protein
MNNEVENLKKELYDPEMGNDYADWEEWEEDEVE